MNKRKRILEDDMKNKVRKRVKTPKLKLENAPVATSIKDLIEMGKSLTYYGNIDTLALWRITPHLEKLNALIGLKSVKETIFFQIIYYLQNLHESSNEEYLHTCITGPPGHGKTIVAEIICKIYQSMGILSENGPFKIAHRDDLVGEYLGSTAMKTKKLLESCLGGCLFIDEIYSLSAGNKDRDSFAKEAIDTITGFLSDHKKEICVIIAGYKQEVEKCFFDMNPGLRRRFPWMHNIDSYKELELADIFLKMVSDINWKTDVDKESIEKLIKENKPLFQHGGGSIETFISKAKMMHSKRVFSTNDEKKLLTKADLNETIKYMKEHTNEVDKGPPMGMYM
jgi:SpoVK/Ycf46/Vps4 family AAA+-type ATPase